MSLKLFISCLQEIFDKLKWNEKNFGIRIGNEYLNNLRFADDIVLIAKDPQELQTMINQLHTESHKIGLKMRLKTKIMFSNLSHISPNIYVDKEELVTVAHYIYLGQMVHMQGSPENEIKTGITIAWSKFRKMSKYLQDEKFPLSLKKKIFTVRNPNITLRSRNMGYNKNAE